MDYVICPYCGEKISIEVCDIGNNDTFIIDCSNCDNEVEVTAEVVLELSAEKVRYFNCELCGEEYYEIDSRELPYKIGDNEYEVKKLCRRCYLREISK